MVGNENMPSIMGEKKLFPSILGAVALNRQSVRKINAKFTMQKESLAKNSRTIGPLHLVGVKLFLHKQWSHTKVMVH